MEEPGEPALAGIDILAELADALSPAFGMFWEILCALILGFAIPAALQAVVSKAEMHACFQTIQPARP